MTDSPRYTGKIIHIEAEEGYGFITTPEIPFERIFFYWSALVYPLKFKNLIKGQTVTFQTMEIPDKGLRAIRIQENKDGGKV